jgi:hypothetical protein
MEHKKLSTRRRRINPLTLAKLCLMKSTTCMKRSGFWFQTFKPKGKHGSSLISHCKMKLLGGLWNFHVWNPKPLKTEFMVRCRYMIFLVWIYLDLVYQLEFFTIWYKKAIYVLWFFIFWFLSNFLCLFKSWSNPRFKQV